MVSLGRACTSGSFVYGWEGARQQVEAIAQATGVPASSTPFAFVDASRALGLSWPTTRGATLVWACSCDQAGSGTAIPSLEHGSVRSDTGSTREKIAGHLRPPRGVSMCVRALASPPYILITGRTIHPIRLSKPFVYIYILYFPVLVDNFGSSLFFI